MIDALRQTLRGLARSPAFFVTATVTLAVAIGANATVFSAVSAVLIEPLPYESPAQLVVIHGRDRGSGDEGGISAPVLRAMREGLRSFSGVEAASRFGFERGWFLTVGETSEAVRYAAVTEGFFGLLGVSPLLGRATGPIVISEALWRRRFGADESAIGTTIRFEGRRTAEVAAVMPASFALPDVDVWSPTISDDALATATSSARTFEVIGRLKPGVTLAAARAELDALARQLSRSDPDRGLSVAGLKQSMSRQARPVLLALQGAVALVLLATCANLAALVLARGVARRPEMAVRAALGASRNRLRLRAAAEGLVVTGAGMVGGLLLSTWGVVVLRQRDPAGFPGLPAAAVDYPAVLLIFGAAVVAAGILSVSAIAVLPGTGSQAVERLRRPVRFGPLIAAQVTTAAVLLTGAGLLVQTIVRLNRVDLGFAPEGVLTVEVRLPIADFGPRFPRRYHDAVDRIAALGPVDAAGVIDAEPFGGRRWEVNVWKLPAAEPGPVGDHPTEPAEATAVLHAADAGYFHTLKIPLRRGRQLAATDTVPDAVLAGEASVTGPGVAVINQTLANRLWTDQDPVGRFVAIDDSLYASLEVVGVVGDTRFGSPAAGTEGEIFVPYTQHPGEAFTLVARAADSVAPANLAAAIRSSLSAFGPSLAVRDIRLLADTVAASTSRQRLAARALTGFALCATLLVIIGVYGVLSFAVSRRAREFGIRSALGASPTTVRLLALRCGMVPVITGLLLGVPAAAAISRSLRSVLYEVSPLDPPTLAASCVLLLLAAATACLIPARRAARLDPAAELRRDQP